MIWVGMVLLAIWGFFSFDAGMTLAGRRDLMPRATWAVIGCMLIALVATLIVGCLMIRAVAR